MRVSLPFLLVALLLSPAIGLPPVASASDDWCDTDPVLLVKTPAGSVVPLYVNTGARGVEHFPAAQTAQITYTDSPTANGNATLVRVHVTVSPDVFSSAFETRAGVSTGPFQTGTVYATGAGRSSDTMELQFVLPTP